MMELIEEFNEGGVFMYAILLLSIIAMGMIIQRLYLYYGKYRLAEDEVTKAILQNVEANNYSRALQICNAKVHPLTNVLKAGLMRANRPEKEIRRAMEMTAQEETTRLKKFTGALPQLSNVSTLLGLLGTIRGLIIAFSGMGGGDAVKRQEALSKGIAMAFRATFFALSVAVVMILLWLIITSREKRLIGKIEHSGSLLIDSLAVKNKKTLGQ